MTREELADILARTYDGVPLTDLRDEHATHHLEAADAVQDALPTPAEAARQALADITTTWASWTSGRIDTDTAMAAISQHLTTACEQGALQ